MTTDGSNAPERSYGCSFADGNPYDYILVDAQAGEVLFLCVPCFIKQAVDMVAAFTEPTSPESQAAMALAESGIGGRVPGPTGRKRGHNAPANSDDADLFAAFDSVITADELGEEFK